MEVGQYGHIAVCMAQVVEAGARMALHGWKVGADIHTSFLQRSCCGHSQAEAPSGYHHSMSAGLAGQAYGRRPARILPQSPRFRVMKERGLGGCSLQGLYVALSGADLVAGEQPNWTSRARLKHEGRNGVSLALKRSLKALTLLRRAARLGNTEVLVVDRRGCLIDRLGCEILCQMWNGANESSWPAVERRLNLPTQRRVLQ